LTVSRHGWLEFFVKRKQYGGIIIKPVQQSITLLLSQRFINFQGRKITRKSDPMREKDFSKYLLVIIIVALAILVFLLIRPFVGAILGSFALTYLFFPVYRWISLKTGRENLSSFLTCAFIIILLFVPLAFILNTLSREAYVGYLVSKQKQTLLIENSLLEKDSDLSVRLDEFRKSIFEERHSKTTSDNIILGHHLLNLLSQEEVRTRRPNLPELEGLPIYYVSSGYHFPRIKKILEAHGYNQISDVFASSGRDDLLNHPTRAIKEYTYRLITLVDPKGNKLPFEKWLRKWRTH